jgi:acyl carrier protein
MNPRSNPDDLRSTIVAAITATAPDVADEITMIGDDVDLFEEFGLDSMDRMNIMTEVVASTGVAIPDEQYSRLNSMNDLIGYLS